MPNLHHFSSQRSYIRHFSNFPEISSQPPYIRWREDRNLQQYIHQLQIDDYGLIAHHLVTTTPSPENEVCHNRCLTSHLAHLAFKPPHRPRPNHIRATHLKLKEKYDIDDLADLYQIGLFLILEPREFLSNFDSALYPGYWYPTFHNWVQTKFDRRLTDTIRAQKGMINFDRTDLGLIYRATNAKVLKALKHQDYHPKTYPIYRALRSCLERAVDAGQFNTTNPQPAHYDEVLALYRQEQRVPSLGSDQIVEYLAQLGTALRNYDRAPLISGDTPLNEEGDLTLLDNIGDNSDSSDESGSTSQQAGGLDPLLNDEHQQKVALCNNIITELLQQLPSEHDRVLLLFYGLKFTQDNVALQFDCDQATAKRRRDRILATLARQIHLRINPAAPPPALRSEHLNRIVSTAIEFCQEYYGNPIKNTVIDRLPQLPIESDRLLMLLHGLNLTPAQVGIELNCHQTTVMSQHERVLTILAESICQQINENSASPPLSAQHYRIVERAIGYCQYYYAELLEDMIQRFQNQKLQTRIDRVQARWQIEFQKVTEPAGQNIQLVGGAALRALLTIVKPPKKVIDDWLMPSNQSGL
jgi:hypothetical protein